MCSTSENFRIVAVEKQTRIPLKTEKRQRNNPAGVCPAGFRLFLRFVILGRILLENDLGRVRGAAGGIVPGDFVQKPNREAIFVQRAVVSGEINHVYGGRGRDELVIPAVLIVEVSDPVPPRNVAVGLLLSLIHI